MRVQVVMFPDKFIDVDESEYAELSAQGLVVNPEAPETVLSGPVGFSSEPATPAGVETEEN